MELSKKPDLKFRGGSSLPTGICGQSHNGAKRNYFAQEKIVLWGKICHARANLEH